MQQPQQQQGVPSGPYLIYSPTQNPGVTIAAFSANPFPVEATQSMSFVAPQQNSNAGPHIATIATEDDNEAKRLAKKEKALIRKRKRKPETMAEFLQSLAWPTPQDRDEITSLLVEKNGLELSDIMEVPDDLLLNELARAGVGKMGFRMKILNGRKQFLPKKRKPSEHPRVGPDGEPISAVATSRTRKLAMHRLEIAHERYAAVKALLNAGKASSVHSALDQLDIKKSTFFDCKYVTELKIIDEAKFNEIKAEMLDKRKTAKDFNTACYNFLKELKRKGFRIDEQKRALLLPNSY